MDAIENDMRERFGDEETDEYIRLAKAVRAIVTVFEAYAQAPVGSHEERVSGRVLESMMSKVSDHPEHGKALIEALTAIVLHMKVGGTYEDWFTSLGLSPHPDGTDAL